MKSFPHLTLLLLLFFLPVVSHATHIGGGNIEYEHLGADSFRIYVSYYRDCDGGGGGTTSSSVTVNARCTQSTAQFGFTVPLTVFDASQVCASSLNATACNSGTLEGMELFHGSVVIDFANQTPAHCNAWILSMSINARNSSVNALQQSFYVEASLDNLNFPTNSSPRYDDLIFPYVHPAQQYVSYYVSATDVDGDSLVYSLDTALQSFSNPINYQIGYSPQNPMNTSFSLDAATGKVVINNTPALTGGEDNYVLVYRVDDYDRATGQHKGYIIRDFNAVIISDTNQAPYMLPQAISNVGGVASQVDSLGLNALAGSPFWATLQFADSNLSDSVFLSSNLDMVASNVSLSVTGSNPTTVDVFGIPNSLSADTAQLEFLLTARDNHCPYYGATTIPITLNVITLPAFDDDTICAGDSLFFNVPADTVIWSVLSGPALVTGTNINCITCNNVWIAPQSTTTYLVQGAFSSLPASILDTFTVVVAPAINPSLTLPTSFCIGDSAMVSVQASGTNLGYQWTAPGAALGSPNQSATSIVFGASGAYNLSAEVTSPGGCSAIAQQSITVFGSPAVSAGSNAMICTLQSASLSATGGVSYVWSPGASLNDSTIANPTASPTQTTIYSVTATDSNGCTNSSTVSVVVQPTYLGGLALDNLGNPVQNSMVYMVKYFPLLDTVYAIDSMLTDTAGLFQFLATEDSVFIKVAPDSANYPGLLPTYYDSVPTIQAATVISPAACSLNTVVVDMVPGTNPGGLGFIGGTVSQGAGRDEIAGGVSMVLKNQQGVYIDQQFTNNQGYFRFDNLTDGGYFVEVDQWGVQNAEAPYITISEGAGREDYQFILYFKYLDFLPPVGASEVESSIIQVYPNPTNGLVTINAEGIIESLTLMGLDGRMLQSISPAAAATMVDMTSLAAGTYLLRIEHEGGTVVKRLVKE